MPVAPSHMRNKLRLLLDRAGFASSLYSTHSLRIGRACDLLKMQIHMDLIKKLACWRSNCIYTYLSNI